jgi:hypothetical protein
MAVTYKHTQPGRLAVGATAAGLAVAARYLLRGGPAALAALPALALLGGAGVVFSSFTIEIRNGVLRSHFGPGLPARTIRIADIASVQPVENPWYYGWGIRLTPSGMLYNVSGRQAVEVRLKNGSRFRLGTDEPEALRRALERAMGEGEGSVA